MDASSNDAFTIVGAGYRAHQPAIRKKGFWARLKGKPTLSVAVFSVIALGCLFSNLIINHDPAELFLMNVNEAPNAEFWFGTDSLGRDIYSIIWYGGRASIFIGLMSAAVITLIGVSYGCLSGVASGVVDSAMMRAVELLQSVPVLLSLLLILSLMGKPNELTIALVIAIPAGLEFARYKIKRIKDRSEIENAPSPSESEESQSEKCDISGGQDDAKPDNSCETENNDANQGEE